MRRTALGLGLLLLAFGQADPEQGIARAQSTCTVPGSHPTIQAAVDDVACESIALTATDYAETVIVTRSLTLTGGPLILHGEPTVSGTGAEVDVENVALAPSPVFMDGFESGDTPKWSGETW